MMRLSREWTVAGLIVALYVAISTVTIGSPDDAGAGHIPDTSAAWTIDMDATLNSASELGPTDSCVEIAADSTVTLDITVRDIPVVNVNDPDNPNDTTGGMIAFAYTLTYSSTEISIETADPDFLLGLLPTSNLILAGDETLLPDTDGTFFASVADLGNVGPTTESGTGVLERLTLHIAQDAPSGVYPLALVTGETGHADAANEARGAPITYSGLIAVGAPCPGPALTGDVDCSGTVTSVDALKVLRYAASLSVAQTEPCSDVGTQSPAVGDADCSGTANSVDALKILRFGAGLSYTKVHFCPDIGA